MRRQTSKWILLIFFLGLVLLPFALEPIQADDLTSFLTINQINGDKGLFAGLQYWLWLQRTMTGHFVPVGWTLQWFDISALTYLQHCTHINITFLYFIHNFLVLLVTVLLAIFLIHYAIFTLERSGKENLKRNLAWTVLTLGILLVNHSTWSIDPFSQHFVYGVGNTVLTFLSMALYNQFIAAQVNQIKKYLLYLSSSILAAFSYDLFYPIMTIWIVYTYIYLRTKSRSQEKIKIRLKALLGFLTVGIFFLISQTLKGGVDYPGTHLTINETTIRATSLGILSLFPPAGLARAAHVYENFPYFSSLSLFIASLLLTIFLFLLLKMPQPQSIENVKGSNFLLIGLIFIVIGATFSQVANQQWGPVMSHLGNIYLYASTCTILISIVIHRTITSLLIVESSKMYNHIRLIMVFLSALFLTLNTLTSWHVLKMDGRYPDSAIVQASLVPRDTDQTGCAAILNFKKIGYPIEYQDLVIKTANSIHILKFNESICSDASRK
jgi:hypothetical protein